MNETNTHEISAISNMDSTGSVRSEEITTSLAEFSGLLVIEQLRNYKHQKPTQLFLTYTNFWNGSEESTAASDSNFIFNYFKHFPVKCSDSFLSKVKGNHLELKLCEKTDSNQSRVIASTRLPLHQFYIAYRDAAMIRHLSGNTLPNISFDAWSNFISSDSSDHICQGKILLAIGTKCQIENLKQQRSYTDSQTQEKNRAIEHDTNGPLKNKLTAFIESLSTKLPEQSESNNYRKADADVSILSSSPAQPQLRKTSELLESLQKALSLPAPTFGHANHCSPHDSAKVNIIVIISQANHLPKVIKKKQNRRKNKNSVTSQKTEFEPSTYVTFESCLEQLNESSLPSNIVKSHEGFVHCTSVVKSCDPQWNQDFNVHIPLDVLKNPQKRFIVKVWRKVAQDSDMTPAPFEDAVVGFSAIDLSPLLSGPPMIDGIFNIVDFSGNSKGQIKLSLKLKEMKHNLVSNNPLMSQLNIDVGQDVGTIIDEPGSNILSRTLKRKFTELDEISQRLKARLFDVTGDENFDPDDEFERDLNTAVDEMEDDSMILQQDFAWLKSDSNGVTSDFQEQLNKLLENQPSTSTNNVEKNSSEQTSNSSDSHSMSTNHLMEKLDLNNLMNPSIFKSILGTDSFSESSINDDEDKTKSSILTSQVQTIQDALKNASLADASSDQNIATKKLTD